MPRRISEDQTRKQMKVSQFAGGIDSQLEQAGWYLRDHTRVNIIWRQFKTYVTQHNYNADQIRFLRAVQSVFLQKRHLETADLYDAPALIGFGQDAVERWFTEKEIEDIIALTQSIVV